jgi:hypothetical protein
MLHDDATFATSTSQPATGPIPVNAPVEDKCPDAPPFYQGGDDVVAFLQSYVPSGAYVLDQFAPTPVAGDLFAYTLASYRAELAARGWRRVVVTDAITGAPGSYAQLWYGALDTLTDAEIANVEKQPFHAEFSGKVLSFQRERLIAMPYDPGPDPDRKDLGAGPPNVLVINRIGVQPGAMARFSYLKKTFFKPTLEGEPFDWRLVTAAAVASAPGTVIQIWELPDANRLPYTMQRMGQYATYRNCLQPCIAREDQQIHEATDWS